MIGGEGLLTSALHPALDGGRVDSLDAGHRELAAESNHWPPHRCWYCPEMIAARDGLQIGAVTYASA